jgi:hypothetical protein
MDYTALYRVSQEDRSIFWEVIVWDILRKNVYINISLIPNGFRYLVRSILNLALNIYLLSLSMSSHNSQVTIRTDSHASDIGILRWEGRKNIGRQIQNTARHILETDRNRTHVHINFFLEWTILWRPRLLTFPPGISCIQSVSEVTVKNLRIKLHICVSKKVKMGPQMNRLRDIAHFVLRSATDLFIRTLISSFSPVPEVWDWIASTLLVRG